MTGGVGAVMEPITRGRVRVERGAKRIRAFLGGRAIADTTRVLLVWEVPYYPTYYFPREDVAVELKPNGRSTHVPSRGDSLLYDVEGVVDAALAYPASPIEELRDHVRLDWEAMDAWFEEDEEVYVHARDPYTRVDILPSSRRVRVEVDGVTVADSHNPRILFETGLPPRYYVPKTDVRLDLLTPTDTVSRCPYKGEAEYWRVNGHADLAWSYRTPLEESHRIAGLISFYNEKVDIYVNGVIQERPKTKFA
ncbi:Uncharacterized conserved protein, DUF427 family [Streptosporangium subroseum]|uniref:Uncharacterized conserved protein, DUF427 family n=1 Tax=Streptosporangium subroseum TaxID=106412 RepID=A0A239BDG2_9ACTN|nr:DUF427 domain-containing protein [Streptosporangium subroseum]SNS05769.1 Uncharacterized conserved protein, DUF427 family [Streptosporangium subroseum]